jgi:hypothetical protein
MFVKGQRITKDTKESIFWIIQKILKQKPVENRKD